MFSQEFYHQGITWPALEEEQERLQKLARTKPTQSFLLYSEPKPTFTHGRNSSPTDLLWSRRTLQEKGIDIYPVSRGGKWTYHGPGQLVVYPITCLSTLNLPRHSARCFVETLQRAITQGLLSLGLPARAQPDPFGCYIGQRKIASFGLAFQRGVSGHGVALYLQPQSHAFSGIAPCGVANEKITSLAEEGVELAWRDAAFHFGENLKKSFKNLQKRLPY